MYWSGIAHQVMCFYYGHYSCFGSLNDSLYYCLCHAKFFCHFLLWFFWDCLVWVCLFLLYFSLLYVRLLTFYFWHHVLLLALTDDNTTGSLYLCNLFYVFGVIMIYNYISTWVHLHTIVIYTDDMVMNMSLCLLFVHYVIGQAYFTINMHLCECHVITDVLLSLFMSL